MNKIETTLQNLFTLDEKELPQKRNPMAVAMKVGLLYGFLPAPVLINIEGDKVILSFPEEPETDRAEAARLSDRAARHAREGRCERAIKLWKRALKLQPTLVRARRDMGMATKELGHFCEAKSEFMTVLRIKPDDVGTLVALANLALEWERDFAAAENHARQALAAEPGSPWTLNCLGAILARAGRLEEAVPLFQSAMVAGSDCPHPYLNLASVRLQQGCYTEALTHLLDLFSKATAEDIRSQRAFDLGQKLFLAVIEKLAA